jgi:hypothetical protein
VTFVLERFSVDDVRRCGAEIRDLSERWATIEDDAQQICEYLYRALVDDDGAPACALVRLYKTSRFRDLDAGLKDFAASIDDVELTDDLRCLTLLGTAGDEPAWNDRDQSVGHRVIPLPSEEFVERLPMVAQLIRQLGLDIGVVVDPPTGRAARELAQSTHDVFHVPVAAGSPYLPAQDFVAEHGIAASVGFGGMMLSGDFFAVVLFSRVPISDPVARTIKILAQTIRLRFLRFVGIGARR